MTEFFFLFQMGLSKKKKKNREKNNTRGKKKLRLLIKKKKEKGLKDKQYELLPEEAAGLSVVLTVRYICKVIGKNCKDIY